jgi:uncharacterized protein (TIGR02145 family)
LDILGHYQEGPPLARLSGGYVKLNGVTGIIVSIALLSIIILAPCGFTATVNPHTASSSPAVNACCLSDRGNVNGVGIVDLADLSSLVNYLVGGGYVLPCFDAANVNGSGIIDLADLSSLVNYLVGGGYVLPACPFTSVTDIDGNVYRTVMIGGQVWMAENLRVTHYRNGDSIPNVTDNSAWGSLTGGAYCGYDGDSSNVAAYGLLYNWYAVVDTRNIAPAGWHVASDAEWQTLADSLGGNALAGGKMKETGTAHWSTPNTGATNESGFTALPGGYRDYDGNSYSIGYIGYFWSATEFNSNFAWYRYLFYDLADINRFDYGKVAGFSVRCVKDN